MFNEVSFPWSVSPSLLLECLFSPVSLAEYAELHGKVPEQRIWYMLIDLVKVLKMMFLFWRSVITHCYRG